MAFDGNASRVSFRVPQNTLSADGNVQANEELGKNAMLSYPSVHVKPSRKQL